ncbi:MAG: hypothetical protein IJS99_09675 [Synergistaceae bacterium]|nr:hypothetical protein [Synergistaceae bacterium]
MIKELISTRFKNMKGQFYRPVIYEWEEEIAKYFNVPVKQVFQDTRDITKYFRKFIQAIKNLIKTLFPFTVKIKRSVIDPVSMPILVQDLNLPLSISFLLFHGEMSVCVGNNALPIFLDIWGGENSYDFEQVLRRTKDLKIFYVTSRYIFNCIKARNPERNVRYMPLSVADKYHSENFMKYRSKDIDVLQFGRKDEILHEYMLKYASEHKNINYVYCAETGNSDYLSTTNGNLGKMKTRDEFIKLLSRAKISLVSPPGMDKKVDSKYGINFVTPRFYESAILGCALIGRYPDNQEFRELNMSKYCPNITSYEQFCESLELALNITPEELYSQNHDFIINSLTSQRAKQIERDLREIIYHD